MKGCYGNYTVSALREINQKGGIVSPRFCHVIAPSPPLGGHLHRLYSIVTRLYAALDLEETMKQLTLPALTAGMLILGACAVDPGQPQFKVYHGNGERPDFASLNYAIDFGPRCSPPDTAGRSYKSHVWLRANRPDGSYAPLQASAENCPDAVSDLASRD